MDQLLVHFNATSNSVDIIVHAHSAAPPKAGKKVALFQVSDTMIGLQKSFIRNQACTHQGFNVADEMSQLLG